MTLTTSSVNSLSIPSTNQNISSAVIINAPKEMADIPKNTNLKAEVISVNTSDGTAVLKLPTQDGKALELQVKMPILPKQGSEVTLKIPLQNAENIKINTQMGGGTSGTSLNAIKTETLNPIATEIKMLPDMPVKIVSFVKADSSLQASVNNTAQTESISQNMIAGKDVASNIRPENPILSDKSNNVTAVVVYNANSGAKGLNNSQNISLLRNTTIDNLYASTNSNEGQNNLANLKGADTFALNPKAETLTNILKSDVPVPNNPVPLQLLPKGSEIVVRFVNVDVPLNDGKPVITGTLSNNQNIQNTGTQSNNTAVNQVNVSSKDINTASYINTINTTNINNTNNSLASALEAQVNTLNNTNSVNINSNNQTNTIPSNIQRENALSQNNSTSAQTLSSSGQTLNTQESMSALNASKASLSSSMAIAENNSANVIKTISTPSYTISGTIISKPMTEHTIIANPNLTLALNVKTEFPMGSCAKLELVSFNQSETIPLQQNNFNPLEKLPSFKELGNMIEEIKTVNPNLATEIVSNIPQANNKLAQNLFSFVQAGVSSDATKWLGTSTLNTLDAIGEKGKKAINKIKDMFALNSAKIATDNIGDWKVMNIPFLNGQNIEPLTLYLKRLEDELGENKKEDNSSASDIRFMFELNFSALGRTQIDGMADTKNKKLDMAVRTSKKLPSMGISSILAIYDDTLKLTNYKGSLNFIVTNEFVEIRPNPLKDKPTTSELWV